MNLSYPLTLWEILHTITHPPEISPKRKGPFAEQPSVAHSANYR